MDTSPPEPQAVSSSPSASSSVVIKTEPGIDEVEIDFHELPSSPANVEPDAVIDKLFEAVESGDTRDFKRILYSGLIKSADPVSKNCKIENARSSIKRTLPAPVIFKSKKQRQVTDSGHNVLRNGDLSQSPFVIHNAEGQRLVIQGSQLLLHEDGLNQVLGECDAENKGKSLKLNPQFTGVTPKRADKNKAKTLEFDPRFVPIKPKPAIPIPTIPLYNSGINQIRLDSELGHSLVRASIRRRRRRRNVVVDFLQGRTFTIEGSTVVAKQNLSEAAEGVDFVVGDVDVEKEKAIKSDIKNREVHIEKPNTDDDHVAKETYEYVLNGLIRDKLRTHIDANKVEVNAETEVKVDAENVNDNKTDTDNDFREFSKLVIDCGDTSETPTEFTPKEIKREVEDTCHHDSLNETLKEDDLATLGYRVVKVEPEDSDQSDSRDGECNNQSEVVGYRVVKVEPEDTLSEEDGHLSDSEHIKNKEIKTEPEDHYPSETDASSGQFNATVTTDSRVPDIEPELSNSFHPENNSTDTSLLTAYAEIDIGDNIELNNIGILWGEGVTAVATELTKASTKPKKPFAKKDILETNLKFLCEYCPKIFRAKTLLGRHVRRVHSAKVTDQTGGEDDDITTFSCAVCDKNFTTVKSQRSHQRIHSGDNQIKCQLCGKLYSSIHVLKRHLEILHSERRTRPFQCGICDYSSTFRCHLIEHLRTHTGEQPYDCPVCGKKFSHVGTMNRHAKQVHYYDTATAAFVPPKEKPSEEDIEQAKKLQYILPKLLSQDAGSSSAVPTLD